ncbi:hypothetical protein K1719_013001 [Acacia pycnantha]|nr:hypothetical protein K1719_013001 [Acacia pycnantha]
MYLNSNRSYDPPSLEEDDLLRRNSKKIKNVDGCRTSSLPTDMWPLLGTKKSTFSKGGVSFADKLKGKEGNDDDSEDEDIVSPSKGPADTMSDDDLELEDNTPVCETEEDGERNFPTFKFSEKEKKRLFKAWRKAIIIKLLDKPIGYKALLARIQPWWAKRGVLNLINIGHGYYVVKFSHREDCVNALTGGPWMIYDHYLTNASDSGEVPRPQSEPGLIQPEKSTSDHRDHWKVVQKTKRPRKQKDGKEGLPRPFAGGSRFGVLSGTDEVLPRNSDSVVASKITVDSLETGYLGQQQGILVLSDLKRSNKGSKGKRGDKAQSTAATELQISQPRGRVEKRIREKKGGESYVQRSISVGPAQVILEENEVLREVGPDPVLPLVDESGAVCEEGLGNDVEQESCAGPSSQASPSLGQQPEVDMLDPGEDKGNGPNGDPPFVPVLEDAGQVDVTMVPETQGI